METLFHIHTSLDATYWVHNYSTLSENGALWFDGRGEEIKRKKFFFSITSNQREKKLYQTFLTAHKQKKTSFSACALHTIKGNHLLIAVVLLYCNWNMAQKNLKNESEGCLIFFLMWRWFLFTSQTCRAWASVQRWEASLLLTWLINLKDLLLDLKVCIHIDILIWTLSFYVPRVV